MKLLIKNGRVVHPVTGTVVLQDILAENGRIVLMERGLDCEADRIIDAAGLAVGLVWNAAAFLIPFLQEYERLMWVRAAFEPFDRHLRRALIPFALLAGWMVALALVHLLSHYQESRSIYLMRRLPDRWELWRRCLTLPLTGLTIVLILTLGLSVLYFWLYETYALIDTNSQGRWYWTLHRMFYE